MNQRMLRRLSPAAAALAPPVRAVLVTALLLGAATQPLAAEATDVLAYFHDDASVGAIPFDQPWEVVIAPDGFWAYASLSGEDSVRLMNIDAATGAMQPRRGASGGEVPGALGIAISPDSELAYVASYEEDAIYVLRRGGIGPQLLLASKVPNGLGNVTQLDGPVAVALSPDGQHLYVAAQLSKAITVFRRNANGTLTWVEHEKQGVGGAIGLDLIVELAFSEDGRSLYGVNPLTDYLVFFRREPSTGALTFQAAYRDEQAGLTTLDAVEAVAVRPGGDQVFVGGDEGITIFNRAATGFLQLLDTIPLPDITGLDFAGRNILAWSSNTAVAVIRLDGTDIAPLPNGLITFIGTTRGVTDLEGLRSPVFGPEAAAVHAVARTGDSFVSLDTGLRKAVYLRAGRFRVEASYAIGSDPLGPATPQRLTDDTTVFSFRSVANKELVIKVLDGCGVNNRLWVFSSGLTNLRAVIKVTDTWTGAFSTCAAVGP